MACPTSAHTHCSTHMSASVVIISRVGGLPLNHQAPPCEALDPPPAPGQGAKSGPGQGLTRNRL
eukprot:1180742-Prorocentrum_minimum.AAC.1